MGEILVAMPEDAPRLADLYAKAFDHTGFKAFAAPDKRDELITWLEGLCKEGKLWFIEDDQGPVALGHYDLEKGEVITISTRDDMERKGYAMVMLQALVDKYPMLKVCPVTRGGKALAKKCGFSPSQCDESVWIRIAG
jgi:hypothetical protein